MSAVSCPANEHSNLITHIMPVPRARFRPETACFKHDVDEALPLWYFSFQRRDAYITSPDLMKHLLRFAGNNAQAKRVVPVLIVPSLVQTKCALFTTGLLRFQQAI